MRRPTSETARHLRRSVLPAIFLLATACATPAVPLAQLDAVEISVGETSLTVLSADTWVLRNQGLREVEELPPGVDGMLFTWDAPFSPTFGMEDTLIPLDIWWFDQEGRLLGSTRMSTCLDGDCVSYRSPGPIQWALETPADEFDFPPGAQLQG